VVAIPVFISISSHSERDIPNCLNTRFHPARDDEMRRYLGRLPITYTVGMDHGRSDVLTNLVTDNAVELCSKYNLDDPENDGVAVITVSHGDGCEHFWGHMHARI